MLENYLKLIPDQALLESIICNQVQTRQANRGIFDMLDFHSIIGDFWNNYGEKYGELDWVRMYDVYSDNSEFEKLFKKKMPQVNIIWQGQGLPTQQQMKEIITSLNNHPEKKQQITAAVDILKEFTRSAGRNGISPSSLPNIRSALVVAKSVLEDDTKSSCTKVGEFAGHKDKTFGDTDLLINIGRAIGEILLTMKLHHALEGGTKCKKAKTSAQIML